MRVFFVRLDRRKLPWHITAAALALCCDTAQAQTVEDLKQLSIEQLSNVVVTSVSKSSERLSDAAASIYVISHDDIIRSGATNLPQMLRLAPNLEVAQLTASSYQISARGFNVANNASMSNKLLVLIDGRTVYTPLFAGVYWDMQAVSPEAIDRIEVISGPGATLWGANAVNGIINVITRSAADTQGGVLDIGGGNLERLFSLQYGGRLSDNLSYRFHIEDHDFSPYQTSTGARANDGWSRPQGGFRIDWTPQGDTVSIQADAFQASEDPNAGYVAEHDLVISWQRALEGGGQFQAQAYYDDAKRYSAGGAGGFTVRTFDLGAQHSLALGSWNELTWGADDRLVDYTIENTATLLFNPPARQLNLIDIFAQDRMALSPSLALTVGLKIEDEPYTGIEPLPTARLSWKVTDDALLWSAVSRAVRIPTPVDRDIVEKIGPVTFLDRSFDFRPETLTAYELGTRAQLTARADFSLTAYYNVYDALRSLEFSPITLLPLRWGNLAGARTYGLEGWGDYRVTDWWRLSAGFTLEHEHLRFKARSSALGGTSLIADDPNHQANLHTTLDLGSGVTLDGSLRYVGALHNPALPAYVEGDLRLAWAISKSWEVSASGFNLLHARHREFVEPPSSDSIPRSFFLETRYRF